MVQRQESPVVFLALLLSLIASPLLFDGTARKVLAQAADASLLSQYSVAKAKGTAISIILAQDTPKLLKIVSPDGKTVILATPTGSLQLQDAQGKPIGRVFDAGGAIAAVRFSPDGKGIRVTRPTGEIVQFDLQGQSVPTTTMIAPAPVALPPDPIPGWLPLLLLAGLVPLLGWWRGRSPSNQTNSMEPPEAEPAPLAESVRSIAEPPDDGRSPVPEPPGMAESPSSLIAPSTPTAAEPSLPSQPAIPEPGRLKPGEISRNSDPPPVGVEPPMVGISDQEPDRSGDRAQAEVEATKFNLGQEDQIGGDLASVDVGLAELPLGYGDSRIVLVARDPQWSYAYWDVSNEHRESVRRLGGERLALRLYDVTDVDLATQTPHRLQQYHCEELARDWYIPIPVSDRDYVAELGYLTSGGGWLMLVRSNPVHIPPLYPSDWAADQFITVDWQEDLRGKTLAHLPPPEHSPGAGRQASLLDQTLEGLPIAGSPFGSMQPIPASVFGSMQLAAAPSSFLFPSGAGMGASGAGLFTLSGAGMSGVGRLGFPPSGIGMSGIGFSASAPPLRCRKFWLVADAELIVYGATEPDASVTIAGRPISLNPDGSFRFQMSFQDGEMDFPILAIAVDGVQTRLIHLSFQRETPLRRTNPKDDASDERF